MSLFADIARGQMVSARKYVIIIECHACIGIHSKRVFFPHSQYNKGFDYERTWILVCKIGPALTLAATRQVELVAKLFGVVA